MSGRMVDCVLVNICCVIFMFVVFSVVILVVFLFFMVWLLVSILCVGGVLVVNVVVWIGNCLFY